MSADGKLVRDRTKFVLSNEKKIWKVLQPEIIEIVLVLLPNILSLNLLRLCCVISES
jgi:hypothetical protein